jgi:hypothetical protein
MASGTEDLYEADFYVWTQHQAAALRPRLVVQA